MKASKLKEKQLIGTTDLVDFPDLGLCDVPAKVDTGAFTSALHCKEVEVIQDGTKTRLSFYIIDPSHPLPKRIYSDNFTRKMVRNSFGHAEMRYVIKTKIVLFGRIIKTEFTLADRERMRNPVLLGRKLLRNRFIVDVSLKNLSFQAKGKKL
nr:RimK/LysX family protein [uncultured Arsenicibacter sp.]